MAYRSEAYEHATTADSIKDLSDRLTMDVRHHIKALGSFKPMTPEWIEMAGHLDKIATISEMEEKLPKKKADATLWECEELVLRFLLEDGKLNLSLRSLAAYKDYRDGYDEKDIKTDAREVMDKFERGLGLLLKNAYKHVEALQTTDMHVLIEHIAKVLSGAAKKTPTAPFRETQPALVVHYLYSIAKLLDAVGEDKVMGDIEKHGVLALLAHHLGVYYKYLEPRDIDLGVRAFALFVGSEDFITHKAKHMEGVEAKRDLLSWRENFLDDLIEDSYDFKKQVRPLLDYMKEIERQLKK